MMDKKIPLEELALFLGGKDFANTAQAELMARGGQATALGRLAGSKAANAALRIVPGLSTATAAIGVGDILTGDDSFGNKIMDSAAMGLGGLLGSAGGPVGAAAGASLGKAASDGVQFLLGGGKSPEERKLEEALIALQRGGLV